MADTADLAGKEVIAVECAGKRLALYRLDDAYYATAARCTHADACLAEGVVVEGFIECPRHFGLFDIRTGKAQGMPVSLDLATYRVRIQCTTIEVALED